MDSKLPPPQTLRQITLTLSGASLLLGFVVALGVLAGDAQGRVNLLYLLVLFAFLPVVGLLLSLVFLALGKRGRGLSGLVLDLPLWPRHWRRSLLNLGGSPARKAWFFYQSQVLALGFGLGGLAAFFILLVGSDLSFVWRSTLLDAGDLFPFLRALALPWAFWADAQPSLELLRQSQDFRLATPDFEAGSLGRWWRYVLAAQCTYNLLPRAVMLVAARTHFRRQAEESAPAPAFDVRKALNTVPGEGRLAPLVYAVKGDYELVDWAGAPQFCLSRAVAAFGEPAARHKAGPLASVEDEAASLASGEVLVVLVKSWEPPMGELEDFLRKGRGLVLPLDWDESAVQPTKSVHLQEWRRFTGALHDWRVLQIEELT